MKTFTITLGETQAHNDFGLDCQGAEAVIESDYRLFAVLHSAITNLTARRSRRLSALITAIEDDENEMTLFMENKPLNPNRDLVYLVKAEAEAMLTSFDKTISTRGIYGTDQKIAELERWLYGTESIDEVLPD